MELLRPASASATVAQTKGRRASDIIFVRSRIFYAKPAITAHGRVHIGFKHIRSCCRPFLRSEARSDRPQTS